MTNEELIAGMSKMEAVFHAIGRPYDPFKTCCFQCDDFVAGKCEARKGQADGEYGNVYCRENFEEWLKSEAL